MARAADPYYKTDRFAAKNGMVVTKVEPGYAEAKMTISADHLNGLDITHGGVYFALADFTFGAATDYITNSMVTLNATIEFISSAEEGDELTAISREVGSSRRILRHDIDIRDQNGNLLAMVRCVGYRR